MTSPNYPNQGGWPRPGGWQPVGGQPQSGGLPPQGGYPAPGGQAAQGGYPPQGGYPAQGGYPQGAGFGGPGGPGGHGPGGQPPQQGRPGGRKWLVVVAGVLVVALIAALVWALVLRPDGQSAAPATSSPSATQPASDPVSEPTSEPASEEPGSGGASTPGDEASPSESVLPSEPVLPSDGGTSGGDDMVGRVPEGSLPDQVGEWKLGEVIGQDVYMVDGQPEGGIAVLRLEQDPELLFKLFRDEGSVVAEIKGGVCTVNPGEEGWACFVVLGKSPETLAGFTGFGTVKPEDVVAVAEAAATLR